MYKYKYSRNSKVLIIWAIDEFNSDRILNKYVKILKW